MVFAIGRPIGTGPLPGARSVSGSTCVRSTRWWSRWDHTCSRGMNCLLQHLAGQLAGKGFPAAQDLQPVAAFPSGFQQEPPSSRGSLHDRGA